jgi:hypothetical protein
VDSSLWAPKYFVQVNDASSYGEYGNCLASKYSSICHDSWRLLSSSCRFVLRDYVYLQQTTPNKLDVITCHVILRVRKVLPSKILLFKGRDDQTWKDHVRNCVPYHFPNVNDQIDTCLGIIHVGLWCMLCGQATWVAIMLVCVWNSKGWHMACLTLPLDQVPVGKWFWP